MLEYLEEIHPLAYIFGAIGVGIGYMSVKAMSGGGLALGDTGYEIRLIWQILIPIVCGFAGLMVTNKMFVE